MVLEITVDCSNYEASMSNNRQLFAQQASPFVLVATYIHNGTMPPFAQRISQSFKAWHVLKASTWTGYIIIVGKQPRETSTLLKWLENFLGYHQEYVLTIEDARARAQELMASR